MKRSGTKENCVSTDNTEFYKNIFAKMNRSGTKKSKKFTNDNVILR